ncbi:MAG TPA: hypothetical protein QGF58_08590 [Myxococcota bacterium]|nr:hypothetical protein [Myxococcota bacterium]
MDIGATLDALFALSNPVPLRVREILEDHAVVVDLPPGHTLFVVGDTARHAYLIHSGQVSEWRDEALLQTWTKGDVAEDGWLLVAEAGHLGTSGQPDDAHRTGGAG